MRQMIIFSLEEVSLGPICRELVAEFNQKTDRVIELLSFQELGTWIEPADNTRAKYAGVNINDMPSAVILRERTLVWLQLLQHNIKAIRSNHGGLIATLLGDDRHDKIDLQSEWLKCHQFREAVLAFQQELESAANWFNIQFMAHLLQTQQEKCKP